MRTIPEWVGRTDNSRPPSSVLLRVFRGTGGKCYLCSTQLWPGAWDADHIKPLWDGGENREANLAPACPACHRGKTAKEATQRAEARRHQMKAAGIKRRTRKMGYRRFDGTVVWPKD